MGNVNSIPVISQIKSAVQAIAGDTEGASQTQMDFLKGCPVVSQGYAAGLAISGDIEGAQESQKFFGQNMSNLADGIPVVGHLKGGIHYACGDKKGGDAAMKASSRTVGVIGGGIGGMIVGGPAVAIAGGIAGGAAMDGIITGVDSAVQGKYSPYGHVQMGTAAASGKIKSGDIFDWTMMPVFDGLSGYSYGKMYNKIKNRVVANRDYRSTIKEAVKNGDITLMEGESIRSLAGKLKDVGADLKSTYEAAQANLEPGQKAVCSVVIDETGSQSVGYNYKFRESVGVDAFNGNTPTVVQILEQRLPGKAVSVRGMKAGQASCAEMHAMHGHHTTNGLSANPTRTITITYDGTSVQAAARCGNCTKIGSYVNMGEVITDALNNVNIPIIDDITIKAALDLLAPICTCSDSACAHR